VKWHARTHVRTHYYCQWGCWHSGRSTADRARPGRLRMEQKVPLVEQRRYLISYASPIPTEVLGNVGMWGIGKSETFLWFLLGVIANPACGRGHASDGGANAVLGLAIPVDPILPRCPCMCVEEDHMRSLIRCQVRFLPILMGMKRERGEGVVHRKRVSCGPRWWKRTTMP
jgi:hypothetical protein